MSEVRGKRRARVEGLAVRRVGDLAHDLEKEGGMRANRVARLSGKIDQLRARRSDLEGQVSTNEAELERKTQELARIDDALHEADAELRDIRAERKAMRTAQGRVPGYLLTGRQTPGRRHRVRDRFALVCERSSVLTSWHYRVGDRLRGLAELAVSGGSGGGVSGAAGDGVGHEVKDRGVSGDEARGEDFWGALGVPGVQDSEAAQVGHAVYDAKERKTVAPKTWKPKPRKDPKRITDGGLALQVDRMRQAERAWRTFIEAAEAHGLERGGRAGCGLACAVVIRGDSGLDEANTRFVRGRCADVRKLLHHAMAVGLQAVSNVMDLG